MTISDGYYDYSHIALICLYVILTIFSTISYIKSTTKKSVFTICFHLILIVSSLCRAVSFSLFIINNENIRIIDGNLLFLLGELPSFFYLSFYSMALLLSVQIFQSSLVVKAVNIKKLKLIAELTNIILYILLGILFILDFVLFPDEKASDQPTSVFQMIIQFIASFIYLTTSVAFFIFLLKTYYDHYDDKFIDALKSQESIQFKKRSNSIIFFAFLCFLVRSVMTCVTIFLDLGFWYRDLLYYSIFEVLPISLLLYIINDMAHKAGINNNNFLSFPSIKNGGYKQLNESSKLSETSGYLYSKYSGNNNIIGSNN